MEFLVICCASEKALDVCALRMARSRPLRLLLLLMALKLMSLVPGVAPYQI